MTTTDYRPPTVVETLEQVSCWSCGIVFAVPPWWAAKRREDGAVWYCPNGHRAVFGEGEAARLRRQLEEAHRSRDNAWRLEERERRAHAATKGQLTRQRRRHAAGVCPVEDCHRSFPAERLRRHLATVHPDWQPAAGSGPPAAAGGVLAAGPYGTMRVVARRGGKPIYECACGFRGSTAAGYAGRHARTCPQARQPWPGQP